MKTVIIDGNSLAFISYKSDGGSEKNAVIRGFLNRLSYIQKQLSPANFVFCFDTDYNKRIDLYPQYKTNRKQESDMTEEELKDYKYAKSQFDELKLKILPRMGFNNVFFSHGYEGDDLIAKVINDYPDKQYTIVTRDKDLYQCISKRVSVFDIVKGEVMNYNKFVGTYGVTPDRWVLMKAIAGCISDHVVGIKGVGETTALKYLRGELEEHTTRFQSIVSQSGQKIIADNLAVVTLPIDNDIVMYRSPDCKLDKNLRKGKKQNYLQPDDFSYPEFLRLTAEYKLYDIQTDIQFQYILQYKKKPKQCPWNKKFGKSKRLFGKK